jgi:glycogen debranching enzyme
VVGDFLATGLLDSAPEAEKMIEGVVSMLLAEDFLTPVGIRTMSLKHAELIDLISYQGPLAVWPIMNQLFIAGLHKHGYHHLVAELKKRMLNGLMVSGDYPELWYVMKDGKAVFDPKGEERDDSYEAVPATNVPEGHQAWTIGAALYLLTLPLEETTITPLEEQLLEGVNTSEWSKNEAEQAYKNRHKAFIDTKKGKEQNDTYVSGQGYPV